MKVLSIHPAARAETRDAVEYFQLQRDGLGDDLSMEIQRAFVRLQTNPRVCPPYRLTGYRKCLVARFRYVIYFREFREMIWVAAVAHTSRRPGYWRGRKPPG